MIRLIIGLVLLFGGVGAIELNEALGSALAVSAVGLGFMAWSVLYFNREAQV